MKTSHLRCSYHRFLLVALAAIGLLLVTPPGTTRAQVSAVQEISDRLEPGETHAYVMSGLQAGDQITISMKTTSGNLDPALGVLDMSRSLDELQQAYVAEVQRIMSGDGDVAKELDAFRSRTFLEWDDDGGDGYSALLAYTIPEAGDYRIIAGSSLSVFGRSTFGDYDLIVGRNATDLSAPVGDQFVRFEAVGGDVKTAVEEQTGSLSPQAPVVTLRLEDMEENHTLYVVVEPVSGDLRPSIVLRDYGGKAVDADNLEGQDSRAVLEYTFDETGSGYTLDIQAATGPDGTPTAGDYRALVGLNAPDILTDSAQLTENGILLKPIDVKVGVRIERISEVDSQGEDFTMLGSLRMDWTDPSLAFSPDTCNCEVKLYTEKEFDRFLAEVQSRWPDFVFYNQQGNRWVQSRAAAIWSDGRVRYGETFTTTYQADFDFRKFPFDTQLFPIYLDLILPADVYTLSELSDYSGINPDHGEDEFIITDFETETTLVPGRVADTSVSRFSFTFDSPRHQNYYILQVFVPILLIILISWFTFFLGDYTRRIEASAANVLLFIAFSFSLADNYPRLGYITFLDAVMAVTFVFNTLVLLYNVYMKRLETAGRIGQVEHIDQFFDWAYPFLYLGLIGLVAVWFLVIG